MKKPTVVLLACIVLMVVFFIVMERSGENKARELGAGQSIAGLTI